MQHRPGAGPQLPSIRQLHPYLPPTPTPGYAVPSESAASDPDVERDVQDQEQEQEQDQGNDEPPKKKRKRQALSCTECKRRKIRCDRTQPCAPCVRRGDQAKCQWHVVEPASTEKYVSRAEHDALRARVDALEAFLARVPPGTLPPYVPGFSSGSVPLFPPHPTPHASGSTSAGGYASTGTDIQMQEQQQEQHGSGGGASPLHAFSPPSFQQQQQQHQRREAVHSHSPARSTHSLAREHLRAAQAQTTIAPSQTQIQTQVQTQTLQQRRRDSPAGLPAADTPARLAPGRIVLGERGQAAPAARVYALAFAFPGALDAFARPRFNVLVCARRADPDPDHHRSLATRNADPATDAEARLAPGPGRVIFAPGFPAAARDSEARLRTLGTFLSTLPDTFSNAANAFPSPTDEPLAPAGLSSDVDADASAPAAADAAAWAWRILCGSQDILLVGFRMGRRSGKRRSACVVVGREGRGCEYECRGRRRQRTPHSRLVFLIIGVFGLGARFLPLLFFRVRRFKHAGPVLREPQCPTPRARVGAGSASQSDIAVLRPLPTVLADDYSTHHHLLFTQDSDHDAPATLSPPHLELPPAPLYAQMSTNSAFAPSPIRARPPPPPKNRPAQASQGARLRGGRALWLSWVGGAVAQAEDMARREEDAGDVVVQRRASVEEHHQRHHPYAHAQNRRHASAGAEEAPRSEMSAHPSRLEAEQEHAPQQARVSSAFEPGELPPFPPSSSSPSPSPFLLSSSTPPPPPSYPASPASSSSSPHASYGYLAPASESGVGAGEWHWRGTGGRGGGR
ncbi:hypothetical protein DFH09DRAFT_1447378 [Mycena vulgaris]|nr:hypothetical protein DFH09DRAFT_1447378 [Mycena vulgaris]